MDMHNITKIVDQYGPYLKEIKKSAIRFCYLFSFCFLAGFFLSGYFIKFILNIFSVNGAQIVAVSPFQFFSVAFDVALFWAIIITFPVIILSIFFFLKSALTGKEKKILRNMTAFSFFLFFFGFAFGFLVMYYAIIFLASFNAKLGIVNMWNIGSLISQLLLASAIFGICFQYPIALTMLIQLGAISVDDLKKSRRWAILILVIIASILPPPDALVTVVMSIILVVLYEITILINKKRSVKKVGALRAVRVR